MSKLRAIYIAGPTASGKSAAALALAKRLSGEIINADAMQVYRDLCVVTARPTPAIEGEAPHRLYGFLDGAERCSAGAWARMAAAAVEDCAASGRAPILVGGAGLYFKALEEGLSPIPETPLNIRDCARKRREEIGAKAFREEVVARDPAIAHLPQGDAQRLMRAWEVYAATGKPLSYFQNLPRERLIDIDAAKAVILPPRKALYSQCGARAEAMFASGALDEVRTLLRRNLDPALPIMKALGVQEIAAYLFGEQTREEALAVLQQNTRRYAKRQVTWLRHQARGWPIVESAQEAVSFFLTNSQVLPAPNAPS
jgi:tRNA dimethylallyltransferase